MEKFENIIDILYRFSLIFGYGYVTFQIFESYILSISISIGIALLINDVDI